MAIFIRYRNKDNWRQRKLTARKNDWRNWLYAEPKKKLKRNSNSDKNRRYRT